MEIALYIALGVGIFIGQVWLTVHIVFCFIKSSNANINRNLLAIAKLQLVMAKWMDDVGADMANDGERDYGNSD